MSLGPIQPGIYSYLFIADGTRFADPRNPDTSQTLNSVRSVDDVPGASFLEYKDGIQHGAIASALYHSSVVEGLR